MMQILDKCIGRLQNNKLKSHVSYYYYIAELVWAGTGSDHVITTMLFERSTKYRKL